ncbi:MAG: hypothetical protein LUD02_02780 [Tannerellaceae bacterium]|nr:hypothetical protein [Tannerellaceae bacterium]
MEERGVLLLATTKQGREKREKELAKEIANDKKENYAYIRALLGLADHFEFQTEQRGLKASINIDNLCDDPKKKIKRFQSPIFHKIIDDKIFYV